MINMVIGNCLLLLNLFVFTNDLLERRFNNKYITPLTILLGVVILTSRSYPSLQLYGTFIMISFYCCFVLFLFNGKILHKFFITVVFVVIASISEIISANILNLLFGLTQSDLNTVLYAFALLLANCLTYALLGIISKCIQLNSKIKLPKSTWLIFALPLSTFLLLISLTEYFETFRNNLLIAPIIVGLLIANFITIYIFFQTINSLELKNQINNMQVKYDTINYLYQNNFNFLHDTIWKLNDIYKDINSNKLENLSSQVEELSDNILKKFNVINTNSSIISSILNYRLNDIIENNIEVKNDIIFTNYSFIPIQQQNELFSIIINNAIDSCLISVLKNKTIILRSEKINSKIILKCLYTFCEEYERVNENRLVQLSAIIKKNYGTIHCQKKENIYELMIAFDDYNQC